jgi:exopolysaccharide biosynthesis protein
MKSLAFLLSLNVVVVTAQTPKDSLALANAPWQTEKLSKGIVWKRAHFQQKELFDANQSINVIEIDHRRRSHTWEIITADSLNKKDKKKGILRPTSQLAKDNGAFVAINGGFFDVKNGGSVDFIKIKGYIPDTTRALKGSKATFHGQVGITVDNNRFQLLKGEPFVGWEYNLPVENLLLSGPLLRWNSVNEKLPKNAFNDNRHPRSCVCTTQSGKTLLITVDGRTPESDGMNLHELTFLTRQFGCTSALNLDGGGSTTLWIKGKGVVNYPCDNKKFDHEGERSVSNALILKIK